MSLRAHLAALVMVSLAPMVLFSGYLVWQDLASDEELRRLGMRDTVGAFTLALDWEIESYLSVLKTLADSPDLAAHDLRRFQELCARVAARRQDSRIAVFDASGQQVANSNHPYAFPVRQPLRDSRPPGADPRFPNLPLGGAESIRRALETKRPVVSNLFVSLDTRQPSVGIALPVMDGRSLAYVLELTVQSDSLRQIFHEQEVPATLTAAIIDQRRLVITRTVNADTVVGRPPSVELAADMSRREEGEGRGRTLEGVPVYYAYSRCRLAPWSVAIAWTRDSADARTRRTLFILGGGAFLTLALGLSLATVVGRRIATSISALANSAESFASGAHPNVPGSDVREVRELHRALVLAGERKRAQDEMKRVNVDLDRQVRERTAELESFTYTVAHDLRAPLRAMQGYADIVLEDAGERLEPPQRDHLKRVKEAATRMDSLVRDLLSYSRLGLTEIRLGPVDLGALVHEVLGNMEQELKSREAKVVVEEPLPSVQGHGPLLFQVVTNLVSNAVKFVAPGVRPRVRISAYPVDGKVRLTVVDNGIGVDLKYMEKLFGVFERLHPGSDYPGTGIGLAIVKRAVERMGGQVGVESRQGAGSVFWIELPLASSG